MKRSNQVLVLGTGSHVGKSLVAAGLCRILADRGYRVAPFKAQNMALNSAVADDGGEIGRAQWLQAVAARTPSDTRMNPVLLKPVRSGGCQLVLLGKAQGSFSTRAYFRRWPAVARSAEKAWRSLASDYEALVMEGAGSPAEVNLSRRDLSNLETARFSRASFILVADIERGGAFAAVVGTLALLPAWLRRRCLGVVFNKFRGDVSLMKGGLTWLERRGIRPLGVLPFCEGLCLEEEDSLGLPSSKTSTKAEKHLVADVISNRFISNFNDLLPLEGLAKLELRWVRPGQKRSQPDLVVLPGSKDTLADLAALRESGEAAQLERWRKRGTWFLGICGGFQMLGRSLNDPHGVDSGSGSAVGKGTAKARERGRVTGTGPRPLGWLDAHTTMAVHKVLRLRRLTAHSSLGTFALEGYEIHHGRTRLGKGLRLEAGDVDSPLLVRSNDGKVWGSYLHGLLDLPGFREAFLARLARARRKVWGGGENETQGLRRERSLRRWAAHLHRHLDLSFLPPARGRS